MHTQTCAQTDTWTHRHARPGQIHIYVKLLTIDPSILVTDVMELMSPRLWSSIKFMSEKFSPTYVTGFTKRGLPHTSDLQTSTIYNF